MPDAPLLPSRDDDAGAGGELAELPRAAEARAELPGSATLPSPGATPVDAPQAARPQAATLRGSLADRIRDSTAAGGLDALPADFGEGGGDWQCIHSDDPFERLYLDWRQPGQITPALVRRHYELLEAFWAEKVKALQTGAARQQLAKRYGGPFASPEMVLSYPNELKKTYARLATAEQIDALLAERRDLRLQAAHERLEPLVRHALLDGVLQPEEGMALLDEAKHLGVTRAAVAEFVLRALAERGFQPSVPVGDFPVVERIATVRWSTPEAQRSPRANNAFKFESMAVNTLPELAQACVSHSREAAGYLLDGYLERWVAGDLGLAPLAGRIKRVVADYRDAPRRAVAVFERTIMDQVGIDASPRLRVEPAVLDLGALVQGEASVGYLSLHEENGRHCWGRVVASHELQGLQYPKAFEGNGRCELIVDTTFWAPGAYVLEFGFEAEGALAPVKARGRLEVLPLQVQITPELLKFGLRYGRRAEQRVTVAVVGGRGQLVARPALADAVPGLELEGAMSGQAGEVLVRMDGAALRAGTRRVTEMVLQSNAGLIRVPVEVEIGFSRAAAIAWTVGGAVAGAFLLAWLRSFVADGDWLLSLDKSLPVALEPGIGGEWVTHINTTLPRGLGVRAFLAFALLAMAVQVVFKLLRKLPPREPRSPVPQPDAP